MRRSKFKLFYFIFPLLMSGCRSPNHILDYFFYKSAPLTDDTAGVVFYDWWRTQPGINIVNDASSARCRVIHSIGFEMGTLPGQFCHLIRGDRYFAVTEVPTVYDDNQKVIWKLDDPRAVKDATFDEEAHRLWLVLEDPQGQRSTIALDPENGKPIAATDAGTAPQILSASASDDAPVLIFPNGNKLFFKGSLHEMTDEGRLAWQWNPDATISRDQLWVRRVYEDVAFKMIRRFGKRN